MLSGTILTRRAPPHPNFWTQSTFSYGWHWSAARPFGPPATWKLNWSGKVHPAAHNASQPVARMTEVGSFYCRFQGTTSGHRSVRPL